MRAFLPIAVVSLLVGLSVGGAIGMSVVSSGGSPAIEAPGTDSPADAEPAPLSTASSYTDLYERTIDSVVKIRVRMPQGTSQGSGFIYDGTHIVTNQHVVGDETDVLVQFSNGEWREGRVVGTDVYTDLAVIGVQSMPTVAEPLPVSRTQPEPGEPVAAIGSPFGLEGTITHGIVSGVNRSMRVEGGFSIPDTVQTDAPINPGNSGGPLVSMEGTVVGVNRAKEGDNVGFAISAAVVRRVVPALIDDGAYDHSYVGIQTLPVTPAIAEANGLERAQGLAVVSALDGTPAADLLEGGEVDTSGEAALVTGGDIIVAIDDRPVHSNQDLSRYLLLHTQPGDTVDITVIRDGQRTTLELELIERPPT
jgi:S1-C subfamily serine protease